MHYYSTQKQAPPVSLQEAVVKGLAPDRGLYMPETIDPLSSSFYNGITGMSLTTIARNVARAFFGEAINTLKILVIALGAGLGVWGIINLLEGYGNDNRATRS